MGTDRPPPYFPQGALSPPSEGRYRKFKLAVVGAGLVILLLLGGVGAGILFFKKKLLVLLSREKPRPCKISVPGLPT